MSQSATASNVQKNFGLFHDRALTEPVIVTRYGRETVCIVSAARYRELKQFERQAIRTADLSDAELALIEAADIPLSARYHSDDL